MQGTQPAIKTIVLQNKFMPAAAGKNKKVLQPFISISEPSMTSNLALALQKLPTKLNIRVVVGDLCFRRT